LYLVCCDELDHATQKYRLQLETTLVVCIGQDEENILQQAQIVLLEENVRNGRICTGKVIDDLQAYYRGK